LVQALCGSALCYHCFREHTASIIRADRMSMLIWSIDNTAYFHTKPKNRININNKLPQKFKSTSIFKTCTLYLLVTWAILTVFIHKTLCPLFIGLQHGLVPPGHFASIFPVILAWKKSTTGWRTENTYGKYSKLRVWFSASGYLLKGKLIIMTSKFLLLGIWFLDIHWTGTCNFCSFWSSITPAFKFKSALLSFSKIPKCAKNLWYKLYSSLITIHWVRVNPLAHLKCET
jgi:hypothetical protein